MTATQNTEVNESLLKKIKALIDKANSTDSLPEREAFMLGAQRLLQQHNLDIIHVENFGAKDISVKEDSFKYSDKWETSLLHVIAINNFCQSVSDPSIKYVNVIGSAGNIQVVIYLYQFFRNTLLELSIKSYDSMLQDMKNQHGIDVKKIPGYKDQQKQYLSDYMIGGVHGISAKMSEQKDTEMRNNSNLQALVRVHDSAVEDYMKDKYPNLRKGRSVAVNTKGSGYNNGYRDGHGISPNSAINGGGNNNRLR